MDCIACGLPNTRVKETMDDGLTIRQRRVCACGATFYCNNTPDVRTLRIAHPGVWADPVTGLPQPERRARPRTLARREQSLLGPIGGVPIRTNADPHPPPADKSPPPGQPGTGGVGGGLSSDPDPVRIGSTTEGDLSPGGIWKNRGIWSPVEWRQKYGVAWTGKYKRFYGMRSDGKACGDLGDLLEALPVPEVKAAQARAPEMFRVFLADEAPVVVKAKHPFAFFVTEFGGLRVEDPPPPPKKKGPLDEYI